jgi:hypothetical protein
VTFIRNALFVVVVLEVFTPKIQACASCGSSGDDPLILFPNEWLKAYVGISQAGNFKNIDPDGSISTAGGPTIKQTLTHAVGYGFSPRAFATITIPVIRNATKDQSLAGMGDPSFSGRYTLALQSIDEPYFPQVQLILGYKHASARSLRESEELMTLTDVFGSGFSEAKAGVDVWFGMTKVKPGISQIYTCSRQRSFDGVDYEPGLISRSTASLAYQWLSGWKLSGGITRDARRPLKVAGVEQNNSKQLNHSVFISSDFALSPQATLRVAASRQAALLNNHSTTRSDSMSLAYMYSL